MPRTRRTGLKVFKALKERGLTGVEFAVSDDNRGLVKALEKEFTQVIWQRCQCHAMKNLLDKVAKGDKAILKAEMRAIFDSPTIEHAKELLDMAIVRYERRYPAVADLLEDAQDSLLACFSLPEGHRKRMRTTNMLERYNQEIKRRTKVVRIFPNDDAALRLITALAAEQTEEWLSGKKYLDMSARDVTTVQAAKSEPALISV